MIVQSTSLRARELEAHLNWLINTFTDEKESVLMLQDKPSEETMKNGESTSQEHKNWWITHYFRS